MKTPLEFWKEKISESLQKDSEKLTIALVADEYADYVRKQQTVPKKKKIIEINAWCAANKKVGKVENISFGSSKVRITKHWGDSQVIRKCKIIIYE